MAMPFSRRDAFKLGGLSALGAAGLAIPLGKMVSGSSASLLPSKSMPVPYRTTFARLPVLDSVGWGVDSDGRTVKKYDITAKAGAVPLVPGFPQTPVVGYEGLVPGRRIDVEVGTPVELKVRNRLPATQPTFGTPTHLSTHLHGSASLPQYDGYASDLTYPGQVKTYHYPNIQTARTLWYHDHGVHYTAQNVYSGLASQYHMHDEMERALLPQGEFDVGLTISDIMFQANASQLYDDRTRTGLWGDVVLVNGKVWPVMKVKRRIYRFRVLNASPSRSYQPTLSPATPVYMVATDGGLMPYTQQVAAWRHGTAERYEILIDFSKFAAGQRIEMRNLSNANNRDYDNTNKIMAFDVVDDAFDRNDPTAYTIPVALNTENDCMKLVPTSKMKVRSIVVKHNDVNNLWTLNDQTWEDVVASGFTSVLANPALGDTEIWEIENKSGSWFHPLHIHLIDFKILSRNGKPPFPYELGPKDVVYIGAAEKVRVIMKFGTTDKSSPFSKQVGKYMVHCHNLVHEDHDMMHQFSVGLKPGMVDVNDPIYADPAVADATI
jgi:FtsP/CotA-like multicopper oxidase with cupredoxin domain